MTSLQYDNEATERLLALYVTPDVVAQREKFMQAFAPRPAERVLDVGSGPGFLVNAIAEAVGSSGSVCGIDISEPLLAVAQSHCAHQSWVEFHRGDATRLPFSDNDFDAVASTQVLWSMSPMLMLRSQKFIAFFAGKDGWRSWIPTGTRWYGVIVPFVAGRNEITRHDAEMWAKELRQLGEQGEYFFSLNRYLFLAKKP